MKAAILLPLLGFFLTTAYTQKPRARDLGVPFYGETGPLNAITDVAGVEVGYSTIIRGQGENVVGKGPGNRAPALPYSDGTPAKGIERH